MKQIAAVCCGLLIATASSQAQVIVQWTFETSYSQITGSGAVLTGILPEAGTGVATGTHAGTATTWSSPAGNGSSHSFSANTWAVGDSWLFDVSTAGYHNLMLSYDQTSSNTGPGRGVLQYSLDNILFTPIGPEYAILANAAPNPTWNSITYNSVYTFTYDLSSIPQIENLAHVYFRILDTSTVSANGGTVAAGGTSRIDNFTLAVVPEPQRLTLLAGVCCLARKWFRRA
jgi:hypothetical protein